MKKNNILKCVIILAILPTLLFTGCKTKYGSIPGKDQVLAKVAEVVTDEPYTYVGKEKTGSAPKEMTYTFSSTQRDLEFTAVSTLNHEVILGDTSEIFYVDSINVYYWNAIKQLYLDDIDAIFSQYDYCSFKDSAIRAHYIYVDITDASHNEEIADAICRADEIYSAESEYHDKDTLSMHPACDVRITYTGTDDSEEYCEFSVNGDLEKESILQELERVESGADSAEDTSPEDEYYDIYLTFAGDINFDENWATTQYMDTCENGIEDCISDTLIGTMQNADVMWINNEFTYSTRGEAMEGKAYTFRADPSRVENLKTLGVDIVGLANNHVYDYGADALLDTLDTLDSAGIPYIGAGRNLDEAMEPYYMEIQGVKIAFVAASRAEKTKLTPQATDTEPGILRCYDTTLFDQEIAEAKENADYVIACVHWGTEYSDELEDVQLETAKEYIDAGADAIIGAHTHCVQGFEFYNGKPVVFSLGNFWFNEKTLDTMLVTLNLYNNEDGQGIGVWITPAVQENLTTTYMDSFEDQKAFYEYLESISVNVDINNVGYVTEAE